MTPSIYLENGTFKGRNYICARFFISPSPWPEAMINHLRWNDQTSQTLQSQGILNFSHHMRRGRQLEFKLLIQYTFSVLWTPHQKPLSEPRAKVLFWEHFLYRPNGHKYLWHFPWYRGVARAWHPEGFDGNREFGALLAPKEGRSQQIICSFKPIGKEGWLQFSDQRVQKWAKNCGALVILGQFWPLN